MPACKIGRTACILLAGMVVTTIAVTSIPEEAYAHGVGSCPTATGGCALSKNEQYSDSTLDMNDGSGGVLTINGTVTSRYRDHELRLVPYLSVDALSSNPSSSLELNNQLRSLYPLYNDPVSWYFRVEHSLPNPVVLKPGEEIDYEIRAYPLKAGTYHVHSFFVADDEYPFAGAQLVARGQTVTVTGSTMPTAGEITQSYVPLAIGAGSMSVLVLKARKVSKEFCLGRIRNGVRLYFATKCSLEAIWLSGLLFWLVLTTYPAVHPFETRFAAAVGTISIVASLAIGSYFAAATKSKFQNVVAIGTASASSLFYFLLIPGYLLLTPDSAFTFGLEYGGFGYNRSPFDVNMLILFSAVIVNAIVTTLALIRKEKYETSKLGTWQ